MTASWSRLARGAPLFAPAFVSLAAAAAMAAVPQSAPSTAPAADPAHGRQVYVEACAACHGANLQGSGAPPLAGKAFLERWTTGGRTLADLDVEIRRMPKQAPGSLSDQTYRDLNAYIIAASGLAEGGAKPATRAAAPPEMLPTKPVGSGQPKTSGPSEQELAAQADSDWLMYNRDYKSTRYSPLAQITTANAAQLSPVCVMQMGVASGLQGSPLFYKGMGYVASVYDVQAFDAATCERK